MSERVHHDPEVLAPTATPPPVFYRSAREFLRQLPGVQQRFWLLVVATGAIAGLAAAGLLDLLDLLKRLAWGDGAADRTVLESFEAASPLRRVLVTIASFSY